MTRAVQTRNQREEMQAHLYLGETLLRKSDVKAGHGQFQMALLQARRLERRKSNGRLCTDGAGEELSNELHKAEADYREAIAIIEASRNQLSAIRPARGIPSR
jgi:hypothetical protein